MDMVDGKWMDENETTNLASCLPYYYIYIYTYVYIYNISYIYTYVYIYIYIILYIYIYIKYISIYIGISRRFMGYELKGLMVIYCMDFLLWDIS